MQISNESMRRFHSSTYRYYVLCLLLLVNTLNYVDRGLIGLVLQPIKEELHLSDTQLGFITGIAFGSFYAVLGLPIARWADRGNRASVTALAIGIWGLVAMSCVFVRTFAQLALTRVAAGIGESGCMPPTYSLVGDYFAEGSPRTRAMALFWLAGPLATIVSFVGGGRLVELYGWRDTLFFLGLPALCFSLIVKLTVYEPRTHATEGVSQRKPSIRQVLRVMWRLRSLRHISLGIIGLWTMGLGLAPWYAAFMIRTHGMRTADVGTWLGLIFGVTGLVGTLLGGYLTTGRSKYSEARQLRMNAVTIALLVPFYVVFLLVPKTYEALIALVPLTLVFCFFPATTFALIQRLVADEMRATTLAVVFLLANLIGLGVGPQIVGILSDWLTPFAGRDSLRYAMLSVSGTTLFSASQLWRAADTVAADLASTTTSVCGDAKFDRPLPDAG